MEGLEAHLLGASSEFSLGFAQSRDDLLCFS